MKYFLKVSVEGVTHKEEYNTKEECFSNVCGHLECDWHRILDIWDDAGNSYTIDEVEWD